MLDLSQFKRSEEEVRAQIEAKQALISEIIEEKVKKKGLIHANQKRDSRKRQEIEHRYLSCKIGIWWKLTPRI